MSAVFLTVRAVHNGEITNADWKDAADFGLPPVPNAAGSKIEVGSFVSFGAASPGALSFVTTNDGDAQLFGETGLGLATPQAEAYATHGIIYGNLTSASKYQGDAWQISGGLSAGLPGAMADIWGSSDGTIQGLDSGITFGPGLPVSVAEVGIYAQPTNVTHSFEGPELLLCRAAFMCGR